MNEKQVKQKELKGIALEDEVLEEVSGGMTRINPEVALSEFDIGSDASGLLPLGEITPDTEAQMIHAPHTL